jgi:hypothetical protein
MFSRRQMPLASPLSLSEINLTHTKRLKSEIYAVWSPKHQVILSHPIVIGK